MYASSTREFKKASELFLDTVSTFTCNEVMTYKRFVELTVLMSMYSLSRVDLKKKVVLGPEIQEILHQSPVVKTFLESLVECKYDVFYKSLGEHIFPYPSTPPSPLSLHHTHTHTHLRTYAPTHLRTYAPTHLRTYAPTHLHTYTPTHLHTYT